MDVEVDHYVILGLPSGDKGAKLSEEEIKKAYHSKLLVLHPDKRPDDPNAHHEFLNLHASYKILMDKNSRQSFDEEQDKKRKRRSRKLQQQNSCKRRKTRDVVEEREQAARDAYSAANAARDREEEIRRSNEQVIERLKREKAAAASKAPPAAAATLNKRGAKEAVASTQCPCGHCQGDWFDREFSCNFGGAAGFEAYEKSLLTKFRRAPFFFGS
ncbi:Pre-mRNA-splicing factor cwc23 [Heracleum sosnowskyi]|uniref:Pre-mRNA-splicing factor cwc23 n=1 Tax=Heracleum sosnowskyi TaxID=360622 RepID=A0AAD8M305_9APIA|nr:Pre-mRNA-splicing factor cwc23 [Heracleum sosnowskyi]